MIFLQSFEKFVRLRTADKTFVFALGILVLSALSIPFLVQNSDAFQLALGLMLGCIGYLVLSVILCTGRQLFLLRRRRVMAAIFKMQPFPTLLSSEDGRIRFINSAATQGVFRSQTHQTVADYLKGLVPRPEQFVFSVMMMANTRGFAHETISIAGQQIRIVVSGSRASDFLWQFFPIDSPNPNLIEPSLPMVSLDSAGQISRRNSAFIAKFGNEVKSLKALSQGVKFELFKPLELQTTQGLKSFVAFGNYDKGLPDFDSAKELYFLETPDQNGGQALNDPNVISNLPVALLSIDAKGAIRSKNQAAIAMFGSRIVRAQHIDEIFATSEGRPSEWVSQVVHKKSFKAKDFWRFSGTTKETTLQVSLARYANTDSDVIWLAFADVTHLKSLETQFVQNQKMQAIGQLAGGVAHDFNNLLTAISGHCDLLLLRHDQADPEFADLMQIHLNANRAASLVGQLLAFSRKQNLMLEVIDVRDTLAELAHLLNRLVGEKIDLTLEHDPSLNPVKADKRQLEQVMMNLIVNARDAMPNGGQVKIITQRHVLGEAVERDRAVMPPGEYVCIQVHDQGGGIAPDELRKIFEPFYTTKKTGDGTGLGLSTVYGIVKQSEGFIFVDSTVGQGSCFSVFLRCFAKPPQHPVTESAATSSPEVNRGEGVILLVEDEAPVRAFASRALKLKGYSVVEADCGETALEILENPDVKIDLFLSDVVMPGMNGPTWVKKGLKKCPDAKVIFMSGYAEDSFSAQQADIENSAFLPKPFSLKDLTQSVQELLP